MRGWWNKFGVDNLGTKGKESVKASKRQKGKGRDKRATAAAGW